MVVTNQQAAARPRIVGRYALFDEIAAGGMATIHLGRLVGPVGFSRTVAIKTLHPQFAKDPEFVEMFLEEARLASRIQHPNVISTLDVATAEGEVFLVMEYVAGESLAKLVRSALKKGERMPVDVAISVLSGMLHGLHATHEAKNEQLEPMHIVHRDVSPQNVLVGLDGVARIFDFGVAKAAAMRSQATSDGQMKGKLSYMSPEQLNSREVDRRTDVFAAGVVAWECLTGRRLFAGSDPGEVLAKVLTLDITPPLELLGTLPRQLSDTIMRALERSPDQRWQTARDFAIELERSAPLAAPHVVGDWVEQNASEAVQDRRHRVEAVERQSMELAHFAFGASPGAHSVPAPASPPREAVQAQDTLDQSNAGSGVSRSSTLSVSSSATARRPSASRRIAVFLVLSLCGAALATALWYWQHGAAEDLGSFPSPASLPEPPADPPVLDETIVDDRQGPAAPPSSGSEPGSTGEQGATPPLLQIDSLPEQKAAADAGAAAGAPGDDRRAAAPQRVRKGSRRSRATGAARPEPRSVAAKEGARSAPPARPAATPEKAPGAPAQAECTPPWYIDAKGIQRIKPMCF